MSDTEKAEALLAKKPLSAYMRFCKVQRSKLKEEQPELTFGELGRKLGEKWRGMDDDDRAEYVEAADQAKAEWEAAGGPAAAKKRGTKRKNNKQPPGAPKVKRALSAYMFFAKDNRARIKEENPEATFGEIGRKVGAEWNSMDDEERAPYMKQCNGDKKRYSRELEAAAKSVNDKKEESEKSSSEESGSESESGSGDESSSGDDEKEK